MTTVVLLVPGMFGYSAFGPDTSPILEYFAGVREVLEPELPGREILVHEPPPTGSLNERADGLYEALWKLAHGEKLPHAPRALLATKIHIVGHSTGGLDARLVANPRYTWPGAPSEENRESVLRLLGNIVTVSAPFWGTPLVDRVGWTRDDLLACIGALTMLGTFRNGRLDVFVLRLLTGFAASPTPVPHVRGMQARLVAATAYRAARSREKPKNDADLVARQVQSFLNDIEVDRKLYADLAPAHMEAINTAICATDRRVISYVTVSPPPSLLDLSVNVPAALIYRLLYSMSARGTVGGPLPAGTPMGDTAITEVARDRACDGVVPTRSQTLDGVAERIVFGDHLDVVGSFPDGKGVDVMRSGARFRKPRFIELWTDIARHL